MAYLSDSYVKLSVNLNLLEFFQYGIHSMIFRKNMAVFHDGIYWVLFYFHIQILISILKFVISTLFNPLGNDNSAKTIKKQGTPTFLLT